MLKVTYLGHSCFMLDDGTYKLIIDPFITGNPQAPVKADEIDVNYIVLTHGHGDHLGDSLDIAKRCDATIIATNELANYVASQGAKAHNMHIGGGYNFPFGRVKFTIAHHGSAGMNNEYLGNPAGVVITMGGKKVYHAGDTGLFLDMKLIGEMDKIDIYMAPIGDNFTMGIDDAVKSVEFVNPELTVPMHYNTFPVIPADPEEFKKKVEAIGKKAMVFPFGHTETFE
jgi:L-ascorbate metabolism protein UlaG (beta-lactamase superfamily)